MKRFHYPVLLLVLWSFFTAAAHGVTNTSADAAYAADPTGISRADIPAVPAFAPDKPAPSAAPEGEKQLAGIWPFGKKAEKADAEIVKPKSVRKAFFLSLILPGLGEYYVGSKRGVAFLGVEAAGWWMYTHYTNKGNDLEDEFEAFADAHWRYSSPSGEYSYVEWFADKLRDNNISDEDLPRDYASLGSNPVAIMDSLTEKLIQRGVLGVSHALPSTKTQQYYEMIGKYPQFAYGWEDITGYTETKDSQGNTVRKYHNASLVDQTTGKANGNYDENISNVNSPMRDHYEDLRYDSNQNLKKGQNGIKVLILNRLVSAIDAGRLAYHHNKGLESELSMVRVNFVNKQILDSSVPMLMFTKKF